MLHAAKKAILENIVSAVHDIRNLDREPNHGWEILRGGSDLGHDDGLVGVQSVHVLDLLNRSVAISAVVVDAEEVGRVSGDL